jgi:leader peptidase (prepilin peptidase)/N-methyltransferase
VVAVAAVVGAAGGLLAPVPAYRLSVPAQAPDRDACERCRVPLPAGWRGWVRVPARCRECWARLGPPAWLTAAAAGAASALLALSLGPTAALPLFVALAVLGVLLGAIDIACKRLPHKLVMPALWIGSVLLAIVALVTWSWGAWARAVLGAAALAAVFALLASLPGGGLGFGDVKLAALLGLFLGWLGWRTVMFGGLLPWLVNAPVVLALLLLGRAGRRSRLPFGPALLVGALLAIVVTVGMPTIVAR